MSLLANVGAGNENEDIKGGGDFLGGSGVLDSNLYDMKIKYAYVTVADSGAMALNVMLETAEGRTLRQQFWMTSGKAKGGHNYYINKNKEKVLLPGFILADNLALLTAKNYINKLNTEKRTINLYNPEHQKELPTEVDMVVSMVDKEVTAGVLKQIVDKTAKNDAGEYEPTGETREQNEVDKFFRKADGLTVTEILGKMTEAVFKPKWHKKWEGEVQDKSSKNQTGITGAPGAASAGADDAAALFA